MFKPSVKLDLSLDMDEQQYFEVKGVEEHSAQPLTIGEYGGQEQKLKEEYLDVSID